MWFENDTGYIETEKAAMVWSCEKGNGRRSIEISGRNGRVGERESRKKTQKNLEK